MCRYVRRCEPMAVMLRRMTMRPPVTVALLLLSLVACTSQGQHASSRGVTTMAPTPSATTLAVSKPEPTSPACDSTRPTTVYALGGEVGGTLRGNPDAVQGAVAVGERFLVEAHYAKRGLSVPSTASTALRVVCHSAVNGAGGGNKTTTVFVAVRPGVADIAAWTNDCGPCANLGFFARIAVRSPSG